MDEVSNIVICPSCGAPNIEGADTCEACLSDLQTLDVPETQQLQSDSDFVLTLASMRMSRAEAVPLHLTVGEAVQRLRQNPNGAVVVMDEDRIAGIFTERDVLKRVAGRPELLSEPISRYMTPDPVVLSHDDPMAVALNRMGDMGFRHLPVVEGGKLVAMVTSRDVLAWLMTRYFA